MLEGRGQAINAASTSGNLDQRAGAASSSSLASNAATQKAAAIASGSWAPPPVSQGAASSASLASNAATQRASAVEQGWTPAPLPQDNTQAQAKKAGAAGAQQQTAKAEAVSATAPQQATVEPVAPKPISIDPLDPQAETTIKQAREQANIDRVLQQFDLRAQAQVDRYNQMLAEKGVTGGSLNALNAMLNRDQSIRRNELHYNLERDYLALLDEDKALEQESYAHQFNALVSQGNVEAALSFAEQMAGIYPESVFWRQYATNPEMRNILAQSMQPAAIKRRQDMETNKNLRLMQTVGGDWENPDAVKAAWPEYLANELASYSSPKEAQVSAQSWARSNEADALRLLQENTGMDFSGMLDIVPAEVLAEAHARSRFEGAVRQMRQAALEEGALGIASSYGASPEELKMIRNLAPMIAAGEDRTIDIDGLMVNNSAFSDLAGGPLAFLYTDWNGKAYSETNPRADVGEMAMLDTAWRQAVGMQMTDGISRDQFRSKVMDAAIDAGLDGELKAGQLSDSQITNLLRGAQSGIEADRIAGMPPAERLRSDMLSGSAQIDAQNYISATMGMSTDEKAEYQAQLIQDRGIPLLPPQGNIPSAMPGLAEATAAKLSTGGYVTVPPATFYSPEFGGLVTAYIEGIVYKDNLLPPVWNYQVIPTGGSTPVISNLPANIMPGART
jgi:hypothetical protein